MSRMLIRAVVAESHPDWQILEAANGDEAIQLANENQPNFVSMDVNMPGMNGLEAAARILIREPKMRIVMCTANIQESTREATKQKSVFTLLQNLLPQHHLQGNYLL